MIGVWTDSRSALRGQSELIGVVLLLSVTIIGATAIVAVGASTLADSRESADIERATHAMTQLDSQASLVGHGDTEMQRLSIGGDGRTTVDEDAGSMRIDVEREGETETTEQSLGAIAYERGDTTIAYQGGGVWKGTDGGSTMVSPPEFHYRGETLTLPLISLDGEERANGALSLEPGGRAQHVPSEEFANPLVGGDVTITVQSEYHDAWGRFFEERTEGSVVTAADDESLAEDEVRVTLRTRAEHPELDGSIASFGGERLEFGGSDTLYADSYDSTRGGYDAATNSGDESQIQTRGDFHLTSGGGGSTDSIEIRGDLIAGDIHVPPGQSDRLTVTGEKIEDTDAPQADPVSAAIDQRIETVLERDVPERHETRYDELVVDSGTKTLTQDTYIEDDVIVTEEGTVEIVAEEETTVHIDGDLRATDDGTIVIDTAGYDVDLYVDDRLAFADDTRLIVRGDGEVRMYVDGRLSLVDSGAVDVRGDTLFELYNTDDVEIADTTSITIRDDVAEQFWLYSSGDGISLDGEVTFSGVLYAPQSDMSISGDLAVYGALIGDGIYLDDVNVELHFDRSLIHAQPFDGEEVPIVSYLHVSMHTVVVTA